ncbi:MAG: diaminopimelate epimerase [Gemmatimonadaceae bacterium]
MLSIPMGRAFFKMSGSGNDFVFVDARKEPAGELETREAIQRISARGTGVGADGLVFLEPSDEATFRIRYFNSDGSLASLCGNATLCSARLAVELGIAPAAEFTIETGAGVLAARVVDGEPEIDLAPVRDVRPDAGIPRDPGEQRMGFGEAGVPHLVILDDDVAQVDVVERGRPLRHHPSLRQGANVNFVSRDSDGGWRMRTYERGVEGETLACGTGAVATAVLMDAWGISPGGISLRTQSGRTLSVRLRREGDAWLPSLSGEGRLVFEGRFAEV